MAFDDLTSSQRDALIPLIEALLTGNYNEEFFLYRQAGQRQGKIHLTMKVAKSRGQELSGFTESELQAFKEEGYLSTPTDSGAALKIKAYSEYEKYKVQSSPIQSPDPTPTPNPPQRDQVFISYSHKDKKVLEQLQTTLKPLVRGKKISVWDDTEIKSGDEWREEINKALASAKVAVLLVSRDFLASDFIADHELPPLLDAAQNEGLRILWVAVRPSLYEETEIVRYQCVNDPARPLASISGASREKELVKICKEIKAAVTSPPEVKPHINAEESNLGRPTDYLTVDIQVLDDSMCQKTQIPYEYTAQKIIDEFVNAFNLPRSDGGDPIGYSLISNGVTLSHDQTLPEAGVKGGDRVHLVSSRRPTVYPASAHLNNAG